MDEEKIQEAPPEKVFDHKLYKSYILSKFKQHLDSINGRKALIFEDNVDRILLYITDIVQNAALIGPTNGVTQVVNLDTVQENFVNLKEEANEKVSVSVIISPQIHYLKKLLMIIYNTTQQFGQRQYYLTFYPRISQECKEFIENHNMQGNFQLISNFNFDLIPCASDLISLELQNSFKDLYLNGNLSYYSYVATSLLRLESLYGTFQNILGKGEGAKKVLKIYEQEKSTESESDSLQKPQSQIDTLILFDRNIDFVTPLLSQSTYQGLLDEFYGIKSNGIFKQQDQGQLQVIPLIDDVFDLIKDLSIPQVERKLKGLNDEADKLLKAKKEIEVQRDNVKTAVDQGKVVEQLSNINNLKKKIEAQQPLVNRYWNEKEAIGKYASKTTMLKEKQIEQGILKSSSTPKEILKQLPEYLENQIILGTPINKIFKYLALQSLISKGLSNSFYESMRKDIVYGYGFKYLPVLDKFAKCGLITKQEQGTGDIGKVWQNYGVLDLEEVLKDDLLKIYEHYAPIMVRLTEKYFQNQSWAQDQKKMEAIPGAAFQDIKVKQPLNNKQEVVLVYVIGGLTYSEATCFRKLAQIYQKEIIIATTQILSTDKIINSIIEERN